MRISIQSNRKQFSFNARYIHAEHFRENVVGGPSKLSPKVTQEFRQSLPKNTQLSSSISFSLFSLSLFLRLFFSHGFKLYILLLQTNLIPPHSRAKVETCKINRALERAKRKWNFGDEKAKARPKFAMVIKMVMLRVLFYGYIIGVLFYGFIIG